MKYIHTVIFFFTIITSLVYSQQTVVSDSILNTSSFEFNTVINSKPNPFFEKEYVKRALQQPYYLLAPH